jgi:hypothetical protein
MIRDKRNFKRKSRLSDRNKQDIGDLSLDSAGV